MKKTIIYATLILGVIATSCQHKQSDPTVKKVFSEGSGISIATIDTDSIFANYDMVADMIRELEGVERRLTEDLQRQAQAWQTDYENYLRVGATMTLSEQRRREEQLERRRDELQQLEQRYMQQLMETRARKNQEVQDKIFSFIEEYNKEHGNYTIILSKARSNAAVLYSLPSMDITAGVLIALNEDYGRTRRRR